MNSSAWFRSAVLVVLFSFSVVFLLLVILRTTSTLPYENDTHRYFDDRYLNSSERLSEIWSQDGPTEGLLAVIQRFSGGSEPVQYLVWVCILWLPLTAVGYVAVRRPTLFPAMVLIGPIGFDLLTNAFRQSLGLALLCTLFASKLRVGTNLILAVTLVVSALVHWSLLVVVPIVFADEFLRRPGGNRTTNERKRTVLFGLVGASTVVLLWFTSLADVSGLEYDLLKYLALHTQEAKTWALMFFAQLPLVALICVNDIKGRATVAIEKVAAMGPLLVPLASLLLPVTGYRLLYDTYVVQSILEARKTNNVLEKRLLGIPFVALNALWQAALMVVWVLSSSYAGSVFFSGFGQR